MVSLIAVKDFPYAGRNLKAGDRLEVPDAHANILKLGRLVKDAETPKRQYRRRDMQAQS